MQRIDYSTGSLKYERLMQDPKCTSVCKMSFHVTKETPKGKTGIDYHDYYVANPNGNEEYCYSFWWTTNKKKYLAIGGPLDGKMIVRGEDEDYFVWQAKTRILNRRMVFLHKDLTK